MKRLFCIAAASGLTVLLAGSVNNAHAKKKAAPLVQVCNQSSTGVNFATMSYAGKGRHRTSGWTFIRPGKCQQMRKDRYYFRGKKKVTGLLPHKRTACVKFSKRFSLMARGSLHKDKVWCKSKKGYLFDFARANPVLKKITIQDKPVPVRVR